MPWTASDAKKHKKGLSSEQSKKWAKIANAALASCKKKGGNDCDAYAIRVANSKVGKNMSNKVACTGVNTHTKLVRREKMDGKEWLVGPVVLMVEGVHNRTLYSKEVLSKFPDAWNGRPIPIQHPKDWKTGNWVSANSPQVYETQRAGFVFDVHYDEFEKEVDGVPVTLGRLKGDAWIDPDKVTAIDKQVLTMLADNRMIEVSTGSWEDHAITEGTWNNEEYERVAESVYPDHLALLPGKVGACSIEDGGGFPRVNEEQDDRSLKDKLLDLIFPSRIAANEMSFSGQMEKLRTELGKVDDEFMWVEDVYPNRVIYSARGGANAESATVSDNGMRYYEREYTKDGDNIQLSESRKEVEKKISYVAVNEETETGQEVHVEKKEAIEQVIAAHESMGDDDREWLEKLETDQLVKMIVSEEQEEDEQEEETPAAEPETHEDDSDDDDGDSDSDDENVKMSPELAKFLQHQYEEHQQERKDLISKIAANEANALSETALQALSLKDLVAHLSKLEKPARPKADFGGKFTGEPKVHTSGDRKPLKAPALEDFIPKKD